MSGPARASADRCTAGATRAAAPGPCLERQARVAKAGHTDDETRPSRSRRAFTLIELLVVMAVVAAVGVLVVPRLAGSNARRRVLAQARAVVTLAQTARARAASEGRTYLLIVDQEQGTVSLARRRDPLAEATDEEDPEREAADAAASWSRAVAFEDGVTLLEPAQLEAPLAIAFRPHGDADAAHLVFAGEGGIDRVAVLFDPAQGRCSIDETGASAPDEDAP